MSKQSKVSRIAGWAGWCSPCQSEDRPLVLTRTGPAGLRAWLSGVHDDDRFLLLTCNVCGHWQLVPPREQDDPEVVLVEDDEVRETVAAVVPGIATVAEPAALVPAPRAEAAPVVDLAETAVDPLVEVPPVPAPRCASRTPALHESTSLSPEVVAAAARVLAAARAQTQRTAPRSAAPRPAPLDRSRRTRNATTGRRAERPAAARAPRPVTAAGATSIALPARSSAQLVLAAAS